MKTKIGQITLKQKHEFTQYSESAAWTDYVTCEPQTVDLFTDGYWVFAAFNGILTSSTFPSGARAIGHPAKAHIQTQKFGGIGHWADSDLYAINLTPGAYNLKEVGRYTAECGPSAGKPILALCAVPSF